VTAIALQAKTQTQLIQFEIVASSLCLIIYFNCLMVRLSRTSGSLWIIGIVNILRPQQVRIEHIFRNALALGRIVAILDLIRSILEICPDHTSGVIRDFRGIN